MLRRNWKKENVIGEQKVVDGYHAVVYDDGTYWLVLDEEHRPIGEAREIPTIDEEIQNDDIHNKNR